MTAYYGIGCTYKDRGNICDTFYKQDIACVSSHDKKKRYFHGLLWSVEERDIIILKSYIIQKNKKPILRIKAIGIVDNTKDNTEEKDYGYCIKVNWFTYNPNGIKDISIEDGFSRGNRIYREYNSDIIKQIDELVEKYKKD
jgi:hypothetical protein